MNVSKAVEIFLGFQGVNSGEKTIKNYRLFLNKFEEQYGATELRDISSENVFTFLVQNSEGQTDH
jgi:hypothetical protein